MFSADLNSRSPKETRDLGFALGLLLEEGHIIGLVGELGAGKTCFVSGAAEGLGVNSEVYVSSPTFTLINEYPGRIPLVHMDFYRLSDPNDLVEIGVFDYWGGKGACFIEWFDRFSEEIPDDHLMIRFFISGPNSRTLKIHGVGAKHEDLGMHWAQEVGSVRGLGPQG